MTYNWKDIWTTSQQSDAFLNIIFFTLFILIEIYVFIFK